MNARSLSYIARLAGVAVVLSGAAVCVADETEAVLTDLARAADRIPRLIAGCEGGALP